METTVITNGLLDTPKQVEDYLLSKSYIKGVDMREHLDRRIIVICVRLSLWLRIKCFFSHVARDSMQLLIISDLKNKTAVSEIIFEVVLVL